MDDVINSFFNVRFINRKLLFFNFLFDLSSHFIKKVPSSSYISSPSPTRRTTPTKSSVATKKTTTTRSVNRVKVSTKTPSQKPTTLNVPSTSYIYSPNPITRRPTTQPSTQTTKTPIKSTSIHDEAITTSSSTNVNDDGGYVVISGGGITKNPSPTVHITPKPITNLLTSSTLQQLQTKKPPNKQASTTPPPPFFVSTTSGPFVTSSIYYPPGSADNDFHNEGYFAVVTHRPGVSSTAIYAVNPSLIQSAQDVPTIGNEDLNNFPPVRNPNLNMTASHPVLDESDISTPSFVEDDQLNNKIDLLVNKLIDSMQGNLGNLVDIVYERKNVSTVENAINPTKKNGTSSVKPQKATTSKPPLKTSSAPPGRPSSTTKKPPAKTSTAATKKPTTKKPTAKPSAASTTKRTKVTTVGTTKRPVTKKTTTTTTAAPFEDEEQPIEEEEDGNEEGGENEAAEETVEEGEESGVVDESESAPSSQPSFESGKIRKRKIIN